MALINCSECGQEISDKASVCPHCGCPLTKEPSDVSFCLKRESKMIFCAVKYDVYLDNQMWGILKNGDSLNTTIKCGTHHIKLIDKQSFKKVVYDEDVYVGEEGLTLSFSAATKPILHPISNLNQLNPQTQSNLPGGRYCPRCGGIMSIQTVSESRKTGCLTVLLYLILALTIFGLLIVIPLLLRKKTETTTYAVCQNCGYKERL